VGIFGFYLAEEANEEESKEEVNLVEIAFLVKQFSVNFEEFFFSVQKFVNL
jgi:hypothetical protein